MGPVPGVLSEGGTAARGRLGGASGGPCRAGPSRPMPELPEVEALAHHLREHALYRPVARVDVASMSAVKTFDPPVQRWSDGWSPARRATGSSCRRVPGPAGRAAAPDHAPVPGRLAALARHRRRPRRPSRAGAAGAAGAPRRGRRAGLRPHRGGHPEAAGRLPGARPAGGARHRPARARRARRHSRRVRGSCSPGTASGSRRCSSSRQAIAGIGNAYSDEILHTAKLSPYAAAGRLEPPSRSTSCTRRCARCSPTPSSVRSARAPRSSRARSAPACGCTPAPGCRARSAGRPCGRCRSPTSRSSTVPAARPVASHSPTGGCRGW